MPVQRRVEQVMLGMREVLQEDERTSEDPQQAGDEQVWGLGELRWVVRGE